MTYRRRAREDALRALAAEVADLRHRLDNVEANRRDLIHGLTAQQRAMEGLAARISELVRVQRIDAVMTYVRDATVDEHTLVSVIMATRNRSRNVHEAVGSVMGQSHPAWELLAVDDGSDDDTFEVLGSFEDPRVRRFRISNSGVAAARNRALSEAAGTYVVYLDDDNTMHPDWLRSVVWAFGNWPDVDTLYGAMIVDRDPGDPDVEGPGMPSLWFVPFDEQLLRQHNVTDIGAMAHRAGLAEAVFDEQLPALEDWDMLLRLSRHREPLALPVVAGTYRTSGIDRLSRSGIWDEAMRLLRTKHSLEPATSSLRDG